MRPIVDQKPIKRTFRVIDAEDGEFALLDSSGLRIRSGSDPRRLIDYALDGGFADEVSHDYDLRAFGELQLTPKTKTPLIRDLEWHLDPSEMEP